jgi:hypothetical protein
VIHKTRELDEEETVVFNTSSSVKGNEETIALFAWLISHQHLSQQTSHQQPASSTLLS